MPPLATPDAEADQSTGTQPGAQSGIDQAEQPDGRTSDGTGEQTSEGGEQTSDGGGSQSSGSAGSSGAGAAGVAGAGASAAGGGLAGGGGSSGGLGKLSKASGKFLAKNKKKLLVGGGILGSVGVPLIVIFLLLSLFKLTDVEKLYFDYQFTKVHRVIRERAKELAKEAKAAGADKAVGTAATEVDPSDPSLEDQIKNLNASEIDSINSGSDTQVDDVANSMQNVELSDVGIGATTDGEFDISRNIDEIDEKPGEDQAAVDKEVRESDLETVQAGETVDTTTAFGQNAQNLENDLKSGITREQAIANAAAGSKIFSAAANFSIGVTLTTFWCIARDIYLQGTTAVQKITTQNAARAASRINTAADAQREGKLSVAQVGAYSNKFDDGTESFTDSTSYYKDTNQPVPSSAIPIDPAAIPFPSNSNSGIYSLMSDINAAVNLPFEGLVCQYELDPAVQVIQAVVENVVTAIGALVTGGQDVTAKAVATQTVNQFVKSIFSKEALKIGATFGSIQAVKILAASLEATDANANITGTEGPAQSGNVQDVGDDVLQSESMRLMGGRALSGTDSSAITTKELGYEQHSSYGTLARLFDPKDLYSPTSEVLARIPTNPSMLVGAIGRFASVPLDLSGITRAMNSFFKNFIPGASADSTCDPSATDGSCDPYGIPQYGFTDAELAKYPIIGNANYVEAHPSIAATYGPCFAPSSTNTLVTPTLTGGGGVSCTTNTPDLTRYRIYLLDKQVVWDFSVLYNTVPANAVAPQ